jgi:hypothetical protein
MISSTTHMLRYTGYKPLVNSPTSPPSSDLLHTNNLLPDYLILLAPTRSPPHTLLIHPSTMSSNTNILPKLPRGQPSFKHLINFLKRAVLDLRKVEVHPHDGEKARWAPDPAYRRSSVSRIVSRRGKYVKRTVFRTPIERIGVNKVRCCESREPSACKSDGRRDAECV